MSVKKVLDKVIRTLDQSDADIADDLFDALEQAGLHNMSKGDAQFISERVFNDRVSPDKLMQVFRQFKNQFKNKYW